MNVKDTEVSGLLDVKSGKGDAAKKLKKEAPKLSRTWKQHWCFVKKLESNFGIEIQFDNYGTLGQRKNGNSVRIPSNAVLYRVPSKTKRFAFGVSLTKEKQPLLSFSANSETETQQWMANIRNLLKPRRYPIEKCYVSIVDNAHSNAAGLTGLHGDLIADKNGISIKNVHTGETIVSFEWKEFNSFHLIAAGRPEDVKRICVLHTTIEFYCGIGELHMFCFNGKNLLQNLVTQGRGPKSKRNSLIADTKEPELFVRHIEIINHYSESNNVSCICGTIDCLGTPHCTKIVKDVDLLEPYSVCIDNIDNSDYTEPIANTRSSSSDIYEEIDFSLSRTSVSNVYENCKNLSNPSMESL